MLTPELAQTWISRWDRQQEGYLPVREERFTALVDTVEAVTARPDPLVLDLGCGPGSLATRLLDRIPAATIVAIDADPLLLALGRETCSDRPSLRFAELDLRTPGWAEALDLDRPVDAAVSTTALHWLSEADLRTVYAEVASALRPGGLFLNGDELDVADTAPELSRLERELAKREASRRLGDDPRENWAQFWDAAAADPDLASLIADRTAVHSGTESPSLTTHAAALRQAGFTQVGTLWQHGNNRLLCAIRA